MSPVHKALLYAALVFALTFVLQHFAGGTGDIILVANVIAMIAAVWIVWWYQANTDWKTNLIGRTTMGIKGVFVLMGIAGLLRRALEFDAVRSSPDLAYWVDKLGDAVSAANWVLVATVLVMRLDALKTLKAWGMTHPEPPLQYRDSLPAPQDEPGDTLRRD